MILTCDMCDKEFEYPEPQRLFGYFDVCEDCLEEAFNAKNISHKAGKAKA